MFKVFAVSSNCKKKKKNMLIVKSVLLFINLCVHLGQNL